MRQGAWGLYWFGSTKTSQWWPTSAPAPTPDVSGNVYFGVHPSRREKGIAERARIEDVGAVNALFAELDAKDFSNGKDGALAHVDGLSPQPSAVVDSGNGYHLYWLLRQPFVIRTDEQRERARSIQYRWVAFAGGDGGTKDLARVLRVPGTRNYKYPDRPLVTLIRCDLGQLYDLDELEALLPLEPTTFCAQNQNQPQTGKANGRDKWAETALANELVYLSGAQQHVDRNVRLNTSAFSLGQIIGGGYLDRHRVEAALTACAHGLGIDASFTEADIARTIRSGIEAGLAQPRGPKEAQPKDIVPARLPEAERAVRASFEDVEEALGRGETGDAELLATMFTGLVIYDHSAQLWYRWDEHRWVEDKMLFVRRLVSGPLAAQYYHAAAHILETDDNDKGKHARAREFSDRAKSLRARYRIGNVLSLATAIPELALTSDVWDKDPWLLGVGNGVLNLRDGSLRDGLPEDFIRTYAPTPWVPNAEAPRWKQFLQEIFAGDEELIAFVQRLLGYGITGTSNEHKFPVLWGSGSNGKDTLLKALRNALGVYVGPINAAALVSKDSNPEGATPHLCALQGLRIGWASETKEGARMNEALVKFVTGGGEITGRPLYGKPITFMPSHLIILLTNHKPHADAEDWALWERILLLPFTQQFVDKPQGKRQYPRDNDLDAKLAAEAPGILRWLVEGCLSYQAMGLCPPASVAAATEEYRNDENTLAQFFDDCCHIGDGARVGARDLYRAYVEWMKDGGLKPMSITAFGLRLGKQFPKARTNRGQVYEGIGLLASSV